MSEINYQELREAAERAILAMERLLMLPFDDDLLSDQELKDYDVDIDAINNFRLLAGPETMLALLDERETAKQHIAELEKIATEYALRFQKAQDALKYAALLRKPEQRECKYSNTGHLTDKTYQENKARHKKED
ncbi:ead/Ea22-like family protein [Escherichia coli]|nr:ead/Ea22-like family protein [Escherichia coli]WNK03454.1 ead/Ea22-like family protein [Escherichia coli]